MGKRISLQEEMDYIQRALGLMEGLGQYAQMLMTRHYDYVEIHITMSALSPTDVNKIFTVFPKSFVRPVYSEGTTNGAVDIELRPTLSDLAYENKGE